MAPPTGPLNLDVEAISGICGSISIACWVVVFSPQIIENFRRNSADGLSLQFIIVWLLGDVFNIIGAVLQGVLPTMIILAIYYTIADVVLLGQCFYYRGFTWRDEVTPPPPKPTSRNGRRSHNGDALNGHADERTALLNGQPYAPERRGSADLTHLSPAVPLVGDDVPPPPPSPPPTRLQTAAFNVLAMLMVCAAGVAGWVLSRGYHGDGDDSSRPPTGDGDGALEFNVVGQVFGWLCAVFYLGSRLPQLLLNWRRKSTEGVSMLFFLFACLGNLTYVLSIFAFEPRCAADRGGECGAGEPGRVYGRYMLVNASWLAGSLGTLLLDMGIFAQFFVYSRQAADGDDGGGEEGPLDGYDAEDEEDEDRSIDGERWDQRPVLERNGSDYSSRRN